MLGQYGQEFAETLDPTAVRMIDRTASMADRLFGEAEGDFSPERKARLAEAAFETYAGQGRARDPILAAERLIQDENYRQNVEGRAQAAGTNAYNLSRGLTNTVANALIGGPLNHTQQV